MELVKSDGRILGGADAVVELARRVWWGWPLWVFAQAPGSRPLLRAAYRWIAARRHCLGGTCERPTTMLPGGNRACFGFPLLDDRQILARLESGNAAIESIHGEGNGARTSVRSSVFLCGREGSGLKSALLNSTASEGRRGGSRLEACATNDAWIGWVVVFGMAGGAFWVRDYLPAWAFMWALALAMFAGCKWVTWRKARWCLHETSPPPRTRSGNFRFQISDFKFSISRSLSYLVGWVGMDAEAFLGGVEPRAMPARKEWWFAVLKACFGVALVWGGARLVPANAALTQGWVGLVGLVFLLHFGLFHLLALAWQWAGVDAQPIMRAPILATSISEFWGQRWNRAFHQLAHEIAFRPLRRTLGTLMATVAVFLLSGLVHEAVISLPARSGYGLPTGYFLLQGLALLGERSRLGRRLGLGRGCRGWLWTFLWTAGPAPILFHPPFINKVILPFLDVIGAL